MDTARYSHLMEIMFNNNKPLLFVGPTGTGKSVYIKDKLMNGINRDAYIPAFVNFSAQTSANQTQVTAMFVYAFIQLGSSEYFLVLSPEPFPSRKELTFCWTFVGYNHV